MCFGLLLELSIIFSWSINEFIHILIKIIINNFPNISRFNTTKNSFYIKGKEGFGESNIVYFVEGVGGETL